MAGKKMGANWGGAREGSGRKPSISQGMVTRMLKAAEERAKKEGKTIDDILLDYVYGKLSARDHRIRLNAIKIFKEFSMAKMQEKDVEVRIDRPTIFLPEMKEDETKVRLVK